jgi:class 3 adenylate cyclase
MREVLLAYQNAVAGEIARMDGHLAEFVGDGVLAYFGYPKVHEDDAELAVRTAMSILAAVQRLSTPDNEALAVRIRIASGLVVDRGVRSPPMHMQRTPSLALRASTSLGTCQETLNGPV